MTAHANLARTQKSNFQVFHRAYPRKLLAVVAYVLILTAILNACAPPPQNRGALQAATVIPTLDVTNADALCAAVEANWDVNWPLTFRALEALAKLKTDCPGKTPTRERFYLAYLTYGSLLEQQGRNEEAAKSYQNALAFNPLSNEAADGLRRLNVFTPQPPPGCDLNQVETLLAAIPAYTPTSQNAFVKVAGQGFSVEGQPFTVYGVNYYPRDTPWQRFLTAINPENLAEELDLLQTGGINTLNLYLRHEPLFTCIGNGAVPVPETITRLDAIIKATAERNFRLIMTLNDAADLSIYPLYDNPAHIREQIKFLATRYRDEPAILAWNVREAGDADYLSGGFQREAVLEWFIQTVISIREIDTNHLITASWTDDAEATIPYVDFVSFQGFSDLDDLRQRIAILRNQTQKPILLSRFGFSTLDISETEQRDRIYEVLQAAQNNQLAGWMIWTAFDFPLTAVCEEPNCPAEDKPDYHYGVWNTSYFPKLAVEAIKIATGKS